MSLSRAAEFVRKHKYFIVAAHVNLDGDALGAQLAFARMARSLGKRCVVISTEDVPYGHEFLPGVRSIKRLSKKTLAWVRRADAFVALDSSDLSRTGEAQALAAGLPVLNVDHHISNGLFGTVNWVAPRASCTCEMIYALYKELKVPVDNAAALQLYTGILTDTGSFRYSNTTPLTHRIAADLLARGIKASEVYKSIYSNIPYDDLMLLARILPTMHRAAEGAIVWFQLPKSMMQGRPALSFDLSESILNFSRSVKGVEVAVLFKENLAAKNEIRVNFRSQGRVNVNSIAGHFGGGGHTTAAGATVHKPLAMARRSVLSFIAKSLEKGR